MKTSRLFISLVALFSAFSIARAAQYDQRVTSLATRGQVGTGNNVMITGFIVTDGAPKRILIRAVGQRLSQAPFGLSGVLTNPILRVFNSSGQLVLENDNWNSSDNDQAALAVATASAGAFSFGTAANNDSALIATLSPGTYTASVSGVGNTSGIGLLEVYDLTGSARLLNISTRALVSPGNGILIAGVNIAPGGGSRRLLIRAAGPALGTLGFAGFLSDPVFSIFNGRGIFVAGAGNDNWDSGTAADTAALSAAFAANGAFPFAPGSKDSAVLIDLPPGGYTIQVAGVGGTGGVALI